MPVRVIAKTAPGDGAGPRSVVCLAGSLAPRAQRSGVFPAAGAAHAATAVRADRSVPS